MYLLAYHEFSCWLKLEYGYSKLNKQVGGTGQLFYYLFDVKGKVLANKIRVLAHIYAQTYVPTYPNLVLVITFSF